MEFERHQIAEFKRKGSSYISEEGKITGENIKKLFYHGIEKYHIEAGIEKRKLEYCSTCFNIVEGLYKQGLKYEINDQTYYMFWGFNECCNVPFGIAVGMLSDGKVYMIYESLIDADSNSLSFIELAHGLINNVRRGTGGSFQHTIYCTSAFFREETISRREINCIELAYDGVKAFSKLIDEILKTAKLEE